MLGKPGPRTQGVAGDAGVALGYLIAAFQARLTERTCPGCPGLSEKTRPWMDVRNSAANGVFGGETGNAPHLGPMLCRQRLGPKAFAAESRTSILFEWFGCLTLLAPAARTA